MELEKGNTLLFTGDSITDAGRAYPLGERKSGLGTGYVSLVDALFSAHCPEKPLCVLNTGISGNRVCDLERRWDADVLSHRPDWVAVMIGVNDVWRQFDEPFMPEQIDIERYKATLSRLIERTLASVTGMVLISPFFLETNKADPLRSRLDAYTGEMRELGRQYQLIFVDAQAAFDRYLTEQATQTLCSDRVHPNLVGHMIIARAFVRTLGFKYT